MRTTCGLAGLAVLLLLGVAAGPAGATGSYPGETLSLAPNGPDVVSTVGSFVASGQQTDIDSYAGGFNLNVFAKDPNVDPTCSPDYIGEGNTAITEPEIRVVVGQWQGPDPSFSVPFKVSFDNVPGPVLLCAYSTWVTDTAAAAQLRFDVVPAASGSPSPVPAPSATPVARPADTVKPRVTRSGRHLACSPGSWSNSPTGFAFGWRVNGRTRKGAHGRHLGVTRSLRHHRVQCSVTAANAAGKTTALSAPYRVR